MSSKNDNLLYTEILEQIQEIMLARATHEHKEEDKVSYIRLRRALMQDENMRQRLPKVVSTCRNLDVFWEFISVRYTSYPERRQYLREEFEPLILSLEGFGDIPLASRDENDAVVSTNRPANREPLSDFPNPEFGGDISISALHDAHNVFVIHGRNAQIKQSMFDFLRSIDLRPLEWSQLVASTRSGSPYIQTVLNQAFVQAQATIVLLTPDDVAMLNNSLWMKDDPEYEKRLTGQARPNVLLEAGMAIALNREQTIFVEIGELRPFSDMAGIHTLRFDGSPNSRQALVSRLKTAGCAADTDHNTDWLTTGDFQVSN